MTPYRAAWDGARSAVPIGLGYIPVAITFGAAATSFGYPSYVPVLFSLTIFAGGSQFILLAAMQSGAPWLYTIALCALIDSRHLVYGSLLRRIFPTRASARVPLAMGLTDEVFATALTQRDSTRSPRLTGWLAGLAAAAYLTWVLGTVLGAAIGAALQQAMPAVVDALKFALPALFLALSLAQGTRRTLVPLVVASASALVAVVIGNIVMAMLAAIAAAVAVCMWQHHRTLSS